MCYLVWKVFTGKDEQTWFNFLLDRSGEIVDYYIYKMLVIDCRIRRGGKIWEDYIIIFHLMRWF